MLPLRPEPPATMSREGVEHAREALGDPTYRLRAAPLLYFAAALMASHHRHSEVLNANGVLSGRMADRLLIREERGRIPLRINAFHLVLPEHGIGNRCCCSVSVNAAHPCTVCAHTQRLDSLAGEVVQVTTQVVPMWHHHSKDRRSSARTCRAAPRAWIASSSETARNLVRAPGEL